MFYDLFTVQTLITIGGGLVIGGGLWAKLNSKVKAHEDDLKEVSVRVKSVEGFVSEIKTELAIVANNQEYAKTSHEKLDEKIDKLITMSINR